MPANPFVGDAALELIVAASIAVARSLNRTLEGLV